MTGFEKAGPVLLQPGIRKFNFWTFLYAAFICIAMLAGMNFLQVYLLEVNLGLPKNEQGFATGILATATEIVAILLIIPFGALADRIGRRPVMIAGLLLCGAGYGLFPLATSLNELIVYRVVFAVGAAALSAMIPTVGNDYTQESSRGRMFGFSGLMNGLGVIFMSAGLAQIPSFLAAQGWDAKAAGTGMFLTAAALCVASAVVFRFGLKPGVPDDVQAADHIPLQQLLLGGARAARNPRIVLSYLAAFAGRSDNAIKGLFLSAWVIQVAPQSGVAVTEAIGQAGKLMGLMGIVTLFWTPIFGYLLDKLNRVTGMALAMLLAAIGYSSMGLIDSPLDNAALPLFVILAIGQGSAIIASVTLVGQEASPAERGTVVATNGWFGAVGILIASLLGGYLFDSLSPAAPFVMIGIFQAAVFVYAVIVRLTAPGQEHS
ncbi:MAG: MFS transporter [Gammaproteobacteria bacterium]